MSTSFQIDSKKHLIIAAWKGDIRDKNLLETIRELQKRADYNPMYNQLHDLRGVGLTDVTGGAMRELIAIDPIQPGTKRALVISDNVTLGHARLYEMIANVDQSQYQIFKNMEEAETWLDGKK